MNLLKNNSKFSKQLHDIAHLDPVRDWFVLMTLSLLALSVILVWNVWAFDTLTNSEGVMATPGASAPVFKQSSLETTRSIFDNRDAQEAKYVSGEYTFTDPSQ